MIVARLEGGTATPPGGRVVDVGFRVVPRKSA
jgi:hypothetical protein